MTRYSVQPRDQIFVKGYRFLSFAKNMGKNIGKNISKSLSSQYSQKLLDHLNNLQQMHLKLLQKESFKKTAEATGHLIGTKIVNKITKTQKNSQENNLKIVINGYDKEIPKERYISPEERQEITDELRLK